MPAGIDRKNLQEYLSDEDFESIFKMTKAAFGALAGWKRKWNEVESRHILDTVCQISYI